MSSDGVGVWRVLGRFADVIDRGPAGAGAGEDLVQRLCRDLDVLVDVYLKLFIEAVDDKIKKMLFLYLIVCFGRFHTLPKQTLSLKPDVID
jgi:hypothetical protein